MYFLPKDTHVLWMFMGSCDLFLLVAVSLQL